MSINSLYHTRCARVWQMTKQKTSLTNWILLLSPSNCPLNLFRARTAHTLHNFNSTRYFLIVFNWIVLEWNQNLKTYSSSNLRMTNRICVICKFKFCCFWVFVSLLIATSSCVCVLWRDWLWFSHALRIQNQLMRNGFDFKSNMKCIAGDFLFRCERFDDGWTMVRRKIVRIYAMYSYIFIWIENV